MLVFCLYNSHYKTKGLKKFIYLFSDEINNGSTLLIIIVVNKSTLTYIRESSTITNFI